MHYNVPITSGEVVVGKDFLNYQEVLDDFCNAKYVDFLLLAWKESLKSGRLGLTMN